jgi:nitroimidazol reductase NimA-like FMN-containing flavoprotein (pyridoxamine 5'-phosphate oxidase superfamily)
MSDVEVLAFLDEERVMTCATFGPRGWPHLMPLWYVVRDGRLWAWTYGRSQKALNLERDARATLQIEAGGDQYHELRGVMVEAEAVLHRDVDDVTALGLDIFRRYSGGAEGELAPEVEAMVRQQATKRVGIEFVERHRATWDHRKLGNVY